MKVKLLSLELQNFKGTKKALITLGDKTIIFGDNGTGKTTIEDSFFWLFFGKDSTDRKVFEVQPLDENNNIIHHLETIVTGTLEVNGVKKIFKRTLKEKWQKKRGQAEQELNGTTTEYEVDEIPVKQKEYLEKIAEIIDENSFKLLTNPMYFPSIEWKKQREILFSIIGDLSEESVINYNSNLKPLVEYMNGKNIDEFNQKVKSTISKLKDKVKDIPARIDENNNSICNEDFAELELEKQSIQAEINDIEEQLTDLSKANEGKLKLQEQLFELKNKLSHIRNEAAKKANKPLKEIEDKIYKAKSDLQDIIYKIKANQSSINNTKKYKISLKEDLENTKVRKQELLNDYHKEDDIRFNFDDSLSICPTCGRDYDSEKIEEVRIDAENRFNAAKKKTLAYIISKGKPLAADIEQLELKIKTAEIDINEMDKNISELEDQKTSVETLLSNLEYEKQKIDCIEPIIEGEAELLNQIQSVEAEIAAYKVNDNIELKEKKRALQGQLGTIEKTLSKKDMNETFKIRIEELREEQKQLNIQIAELEKQQFLGEEFIRTKVELLESTINKKFNGQVSFKLFNNQINGGLNECCVALINGVPFPDANLASKMNAGIAILNTLCNHYDTYAPVFLDNTESVNEMIPIESQSILFKVSKDKELKVEVME